MRMRIKSIAGLRPINNFFKHVHNAFMSTMPRVLNFSAIHINQYKRHTLLMRCITAISVTPELSQRFPGTNVGSPLQNNKQSHMVW